MGRKIKIQKQEEPKHEEPKQEQEMVSVIIDDDEPMTPILNKKYNKWHDNNFIRSYHKDYYNKKKNTIIPQQNDYKNCKKIMSIVEKLKYFDNIKFMIAYQENIYSN